MYYTVICKKCNHDSVCSRHSHISFCTNVGPNPNPKHKLTRNGPDRVFQRIFRQTFKENVYRNPEIDFKVNYESTKSQIWGDMPNNHAEAFGISPDVERLAFDHLFSSKCKNPLDITSNTHLIKYCHFQTKEPISEEFRHERNGNIYFFIPSHLPMLEKGTILMDGTFSICRHLPYIQCYIISQYIRIGDKCFTMPILYCFMEKRKEKHYDVVFSDLKYFFYKYCERELNLHKIQLDAEKAAINSIITNFPEVEILLCRTHLARSWLKWWKYYLGGYFFKNEFLLKIWKFLLGMTFLDLQNQEIKNHVNRIFENWYNSTELKNIGKKRGFKRFLSYLIDNYLSDSARFPHHQWNYNMALSEHDFTITTKT